MSAFNENDWRRLATLFGHYETDERWPGGLSRFASSYAGYRPEVREAPNGDTKVCPRCNGTANEPSTTFAGPCQGPCHGFGRVPNVDAEGAHEPDGDSPVCVHCGAEWDFDPRGPEYGRPVGPCPGAPAKRWLHVAEKYLSQHPGLDWPRAYLARAHWEACRVATALGVPAAYRPHEADGTLRVLEYPPGAGTVEHTDPNLFTIVLWRSHPDDLQLATNEEYRAGISTDNVGCALQRARRLSPGLHIGEIGELVGLGPATPHRVPARPYVQRSIVAFAMPDLGARLPIRACGKCRSWAPCGCMTVGEWIEAWKKRARYT